MKLRITASGNPVSHMIRLSDVVPAASLQQAAEMLADQKITVFVPPYVPPKDMYNIFGALEPFNERGNWALRNAAGDIIRRHTEGYIELYFDTGLHRLLATVKHEDTDETLLENVPLNHLWIMALDIQHFFDLIMVN